MKFYVEELELFGNEATNPYGSVTAGEGVLRLNDVITAPSGTLGSGGLLYVSGTSLYFYNDAGTATDLTAGGASPGGSGTEFQYRAGASTFGGIGQVDTTGHGYGIGEGQDTLSTGSLAFGYQAGNVNTGTYNTYAISIGYQANYNTGAENIGQYGVAIGYQAKSKSNYSVAIGYLAGSATTPGLGESISIGDYANSFTNIGEASIAIGQGSESQSDYSISLGGGAGYTTGTVGTYAISLGYQANVTTKGDDNIGQDSIAIGHVAVAMSTGSIALGYYAGYLNNALHGTYNTYAISIGYQANYFTGTQDIGDSSIAIGYLAISDKQYAVAIGRQAGTASGTRNINTISIGALANAQASADIGQNSLAIGVNSGSKSTASISIGNNAGLATGTWGIQAITIGAGANNGTGNNVGQDSIAIGTAAETVSTGSIAIGLQAANINTGTYNTYATSIGYQANNFAAAENIGQYSIAIGYQAQTTNTNAIAIGRTSVASGGSGAIAIGYNTDATSLYSIAIGTDAQSTSTYTIAIGDIAKAVAAGVVSLGQQAGSTNGTQGSYAVSVGYLANNFNDSRNIGQDSIAIGKEAKTTGTGAIALGYQAGYLNNATPGTYDTNAISIGYQANYTNLASRNIGQYSIAVGRESRTESYAAVAIGYRAGYLSNATPGTYGFSAISIGDEANYRTDTGNIGQSSMAIGYHATSVANGSIAIGTQARGDANSGIAIGENASRQNTVTPGTVNTFHISIGANANYWASTRNVGQYGIAIGREAHTESTGSIALGYYAGWLNNATPGTYNTYAISIGYQANYQTTTDSIGGYSIAMGYTAEAQATDAIAIGTNAGKTSGTHNTSSVSIGAYVNSQTAAIGQDSIAIGGFASARTIDQITIGNASGAASGTGGSGSISIGSDTNRNVGSKTGQDIGSYSIAIGQFAQTVGTGAIAMGYQAGYLNSATPGTYAGYSISIGYGANYTTSASKGIGQGSVTIGYNAYSTANDSVSIGASAAVKGYADVNIGYRAGNTSGTYGGYSISIGPDANQGTANIGQYSVAVGYASAARALRDVAIGSEASALGTYGTAVGYGAYCETISAVAVGDQAGSASGLVSYGDYVVSIGYRANAISDTVGNNSIAIGRQLKTSGAGAIHLGYSTTGTDNTTTNSLALTWNGTTRFHFIEDGTNGSYLRIPGGTHGRIRYNTSTNAWQISTNDGSSYSNIGASVWTQSGSDIYYNTGNVGIGVTPTQLLHVSGDGGVILNRTTANGAYIRFDETTAGQRFIIHGGVSGDFAIGRYVTSAYDYTTFRIDFDTGYIGIGDAAPDRQLHVSAVSNSMVVKLERTTTSAGFTEMGPNGNNFCIYPGGYPSGLGNIGINELSPLADLHITNDTAGHMTTVRLDNTDATSGSGMSLDYYDGSTERGYWRYTAASAYFDIGVVHDNGQFRVRMGSTTPTTIISVDNVANNHDTAIDANLRVAPSAVWTVGQGNVTGAIHIDTAGTNGSGNLGGGISWSTVGGNTGVKRAALISYQNGADADNVGLRIYGHSNTSTDDLDPVIDFDIGGIYSRKNLYPITDSTGANGESLGGTSNDWKDAYVYNGVTTGSDIRRKDWEFLDLGYETMMMVNPIVYSWKNEKDKTAVHFGFSAQEIESRIKGRYSNWQGLVIGEDGFYRLKEKELLPILWKGTQEGFQAINKKFDERDERIAELEARVAELENA